jgi:uncharacterized protein
MKKIILAIIILLSQNLMLAQTKNNKTKPKNTTNKNNCQMPATIENPKKDAKNILGTALQPCCFEPVTGFYRDGFCNTDANDYGVHVVCAEVTQAFLDYSKSQGNDLMTASPWFPGLKAGDKWCLCAMRWKEAHEAGVAPPIILESTHQNALKFVPLEVLMQYKRE